MAIPRPAVARKMMEDRRKAERMRLEKQAKRSENRTVAGEAWRVEAERRAEERRDAAESGGWRAAVEKRRMIKAVASDEWRAKKQKWREEAERRHEERRKVSEKRAEEARETSGERGTAYLSRSMRF